MQALYQPDGGILASECCIRAHTRRVACILYSKPHAPCLWYRVHRVIAPQPFAAGTTCSLPMQALYQPDGGILASERCIRAHTRLAQARGARLLRSCEVTGWVVRPDGKVQVATRRGEAFSCDQLVLTAGSWMPELVPQLQVRLLCLPTAGSSRKGAEGMTWRCDPGWGRFLHLQSACARCWQLDASAGAPAPGEAVLPAHGRNHLGGMSWRSDSVQFGGHIMRRVATRRGGAGAQPLGEAALPARGRLHQGRKEGV